MRSPINRLHQNVSLVPLVLQSVAGEREALWCLIRIFLPLLEQRARLFLRQEPKLYSWHIPAAVVRETLRDLSPLLYSNLPKLLREAEDDYSFMVAAWGFVVKDFDEILRHRFRAWYDNLVRTYQDRLRVHAEFLLNTLGSDRDGAVGGVLKETWQTIWRDAPLTDILTDHDIEKIVFDFLRRTCCSRLYAHLNPKAKGKIIKKTGRPFNIDAVDEALSNFSVHLCQWVSHADPDVGSPHVPHDLMARNAVAETVRQNIDDRIIKNNPRDKEKRCRRRPIDLNLHAERSERSDSIEEERLWVQNRLSEEEKVLWELRVRQEIPWEEVSKRLGIAKRTLQGYLKKIVVRLKAQATRCM